MTGAHAIVVRSAGAGSRRVISEKLETHGVPPCQGAPRVPLRPYGYRTAPGDRIRRRGSAAPHRRRNSYTRERRGAEPFVL